MAFWQISALVAASGYPAPGLVALAGAGLISAGRPSWWVAALALLAAVELVLWVRNPFGLAVTLGAVVGLCACLALAPPRTLGLVAAATAWFVALGGLRASLEGWAHPANRGGGNLSDAGELARVTRLPAGCFRFGFALLAALSVAGCALVLLHLPR